MAWSEMSYRYKIRNARIVAALKGGGAYVERLDLEVSEGRGVSLYRPPDDDETWPAPLLAWECHFMAADAAVPEASTHLEARIIIAGMHDNGPIEIRGKGWIGFDENGSVEGHFYKPPQIIVDDGGPPREREPGDPPEMTTEEWLAHIEGLEPKLPIEFQRAARWRKGCEELE